MGTLYVVATPIGNLDDVTLRALRILGEVALVAAEDTRTARVLLDQRGLKPRLISYTDHNMRQRIPQLLQHLDTEDLALVTDAGTPGISDPGVELVAAARAEGHAIVSVPGASAPVAALSVAGLRANSFRFAGFLPRQLGALRRYLEEYADRGETLVAFEAPGRLRKTLAAVDEVLPDRRLAVCRELTKLHEETFAGTASQALQHFLEPRGEIVLVIEGAQKQRHDAGLEDESAVREELLAMRELGLTRSQALALLARRFGLQRRRLYEMWLESEKT
jgi:16S rRNA (cytidine1402-2'-O)-methyltransferase